MLKHEFTRPDNPNSSLKKKNCSKYVGCVLGKVIPILHLDACVGFDLWFAGGARCVSFCEEKPRRSSPGDPSLKFVWGSMLVLCNKGKEGRERWLLLTQTRIM